MLRPDISLRIDRPHVTVEEFADAVRALLDLVRAVGEEVVGTKAERVEWVIKGLSYGSAALVAEPEILNNDIDDDALNEWMNTAARGLESLDAKSVRPHGFNDRALRAAKQLVEILHTDEVGASHARIGSRTVQPSKRISGNVDDLISGKIKSVGSIEGRLMGVTAGDTLLISVTDRAHGTKVQCQINEELLPRVFDAFMKRVIVRGVIWSRQDGTPRRIEVRDLELVPPDDKLPRNRDVRGIIHGLNLHGK